jgi:hypothetical protein
MAHGEVISFCSVIHRNHRNTHYGKNVWVLNVKIWVIPAVTTRLQTVSSDMPNCAKSAFIFLRRSVPILIP